MPTPRATPQATPKGGARRAAIVTAAADLVADEGPDAVSHRRVAAAAGVPLAATTYYSRDLGELLVAAFTELGERETRRTTALVQELTREPRSATSTAALVGDVLLGPDRRTDADVLAFYQRFLASGRHPGVRPVLAATRRRLDELVGEALDRSAAPAVPLARLVAVFDGSAVSALVEGDGDARATAEAAVADLLRDHGHPDVAPPTA
ncbi:TetR/AcrR family transcriptional regulator [Modestobacter sp. Leaf380]|uniref:TetR/AcrR family transcriptional regulator n=1 Tax=Modestobacter sp. Leaf380 TaxID=1736356 RepID=UPI0006F94512|nr:TetR family transcriptional regulator [Modestobacter sp. Leaf380]KQS71845.1 hypothetical protein ASG41_19175 [Modestobacter sp. Leaf380]